MDAAAAPQEEDRRIRREIVVFGSQPGHHHPVQDRLAERGYLGVNLLDLTPELREHFGASRQSGVLVARVAADSPAEAAGLAVGDVISAIDGEPCGTSSQLAGRIGRHHQGDEIELRVWRDRAPLTLRATLAKAERRQLEVGQLVWHGAEEERFLVELDPELAERVGPLDAQAMARVMALDPDVVARVITVDPETVNESISRLLERLEAEGGLSGRLLLEDEQRQLLEKRIAELEARLRDMERLLHRQHDD